MTTNNSINLSNSGIVSYDGSGTFVGRTLTAGSSKISISNGSGISAAPTFDAVEANFTLNNIGGTLGVSKGGTGDTSLTAYAVLCGGTTSTGAVQSIASVGTSGDVLSSAGASTLPSFVNVGSLGLRPGDVFNLGINYNAGTGVFKVTSASGSALSSTNPGYVVLQSKNTPGTLVKYTITADQSFIDDNGASEIIGNLFGYTTGVAIATDVPFFIYAVSADDQTTLQFMLSRIPHASVAPAVGSIGTPASAVADTQGSFFSFDSVTVASYDLNPCCSIGSIRMRMSALDDWTVQTIATTDGIGQFQDETLFTTPLGQFGANASTYTLPNGGTAATFTNKTSTYQIKRNGLVHFMMGMDSDAGTDGATAVNAEFSCPVRSNLQAAWLSGYIFLPAGNALISTAQINHSVDWFTIYINAQATPVLWSQFTNGGRIVVLSGQYIAGLV